MHEDEGVIAASLALVALAAARDRLLLGGGSNLSGGTAPADLTREVEPPLPLPPGSVQRGRLLFRQHACWTCHQDRQGANAPSLVGVADAYLVSFKSQARARDPLGQFLRAPRQGRGLLKGKFTSQMQPLPVQLLGDAQLEDLVSYLLSRRGDLPVSEDR